MTRSERLEPVLKHASKKEQTALRAMAASQNLVAEENSKLAQLNLYRDEYMNRQQQSYSVVEIQEYNRFLLQLDDTINKQKNVIKLKEAVLQQKRAAWQQTRVSSKAVHKVVENLQQEANSEQQLIEQKAMDEFSQRKHHHY